MRTRAPRSFTVGAAGTDHITVSVVPQAFPLSDYPTTPVWVDAEISIHLRPWRATYRADLTTDEFTIFLRELEGMHAFQRRRAGFYAIEPWLELTLEMDDLGRIDLAGYAGPEGFGRAFADVKLEFNVKEFIEHSSLPQVIAELREIERAFRELDPSAEAP